MRFWWVNQGQTATQEISGGYMWSPFTSKGGRRNPFYDFMKAVEPGNPILSYYGSAIQQVGLALTTAYESTKPPEFGESGAEWDEVGHRIDVFWSKFPQPLVPREYIQEIQPLLPEKYSPLHPETGHGREAYLFEIREELYAFIIGRMGKP